MQRESLLIAFEGPDGSGKNTQVKALQKILKGLYQIDAVLFSFPRYETPTGKKVWEMLHGEFGKFSQLILTSRS